MGITSNVDAHNYDYFHACEIREVHGSVELYQCAKPKSIACPGVWRAPLSFRYHVDKTTMSATDAPPETTQEFDLAGSRRRPTLLQNMPEPAVDAAKGFLTNHPKCIFCHGAARPSVLMFDDEDCRDAEHWQDVKTQSQRKATWVHAVLNLIQIADAPVKVVILEVGCGGRVTTCRTASEQLMSGYQDAGADVCLIRINPEFPLGDSEACAPGGRLEAHMISIMARGLEALQSVERAMNAATLL